MEEKNIHMESMTFQFLINEDQWQLNLPKSQTHVQDVRQLALITERADWFVPAEVKDGEEDAFTFLYTVDSTAKRWNDILKLTRHEKLRLLCNLARLRKLLATRITFFLHPENLVFDDNLMPSLVYRGIREAVPPYTTDEEKFVLQYRCMAIALFSKKYSFEELYNGAINSPHDTEFERLVSESSDFDSLVNLLEESYLKEKMETEKKMQFVPKKRFRLFKQLTYTLIVLIVISAVVLTYESFVKIPFQNHLLEAHHYYLAQDYEGVINELQKQDPEKLPNESKYILAYSYIKTEILSEDQKEAIMKNMSVKSDENYLLYWIFNGRGNFNKSVDLAKYIDDPQLIMYGLIKQMEKAKNDPNLSGTKREQKISQYEEELKKYQEKYGQDSSVDSEAATDVSTDLNEQTTDLQNQDATTSNLEKKTNSDKDKVQSKQEDIKSRETRKETAEDKK
ncbi:type VII secretion protein EssB [Cytobacillus sp. Hz8]|uniref:type VII secretion protein EssB n=1 Tax=Cytobacillus sp. Hz8 TaxID=3347168 RepID=UPI0035DAFF96